MDMNAQTHAQSTMNDSCGRQFWCVWACATAQKPRLPEATLIFDDNFPASLTPYFWCFWTKFLAFFFYSGSFISFFVLYHELCSGSGDGKICRWLLDTHCRMCSGLLVQIGIMLDVTGRMPGLSYGIVFESSSKKFRNQNFTKNALQLFGIDSAPDKICWLDSNIQYIFDLPVV